MSYQHHQGWRDQYGNQYGGQQQQGQNGGAYPGQYQYANQQPYEQYAATGPGAQQQQATGGYQQQDDGHASPRQTSFGAAYPGQQQYSYNPQHYAPPPPPAPTQQYQQQQTPIQQYNPQSYANTTNQSGYGQQYNPQLYSPSAAYSDQPSSSISGPVDPYAYQQAAYSPQVQQQQYAQSPMRQNFPSQQQPQQYSPQIPTHQYSYQSQQQTSPPPQQHWDSYAPPPAPTTTVPQPRDVPYPTIDYQPQHTQRTTSIRQQQSPAFGISPSLPGFSQDDWRPSPPSHHDPRQSPSPLHPSSSLGSLPSPPSTDGPTPPAHGGGPSRSESNRHPQSRPLPGFPEPDGGADYFHNRPGGRRDLSREEQEALSQEDLFQQVEDAIFNVGRPGSYGGGGGGHSPTISVSQAPPHSSSSTSTGGVQRNGSVVNGHLSPTPPDQQTQTQHYSSDDDPEASQGLEMMRMAEEDDQRRRNSGGSQITYRPGSGSGYGGSPRNSRGQQQTHLAPQREASDSDDYGTIDMSSFGGGYDVGGMSYGGDPAVLAVGGDVNGTHTGTRDSYSYSYPVSSQHSSMRRSHASQSSQASQQNDYGSIHPFPPFNPAARVDAGGTGGLQEPTANAFVNGRRQSYDEGDEYALTDGGRFPDEPLDVFYQPATTSYRPLPATPEGSVSGGAGAGPTVPMHALQTNNLQGQGPGFPLAPGDYQSSYNQQGQWVPRSTSLGSHTTQQPVSQPLRSKTDAEERKRAHQQQAGYRGSGNLSTIEGTPAALTPAIDLPSLPGKRFIPSQLGAPAFKKCEEPWSLEGILKWLVTVTNPEQITELKEAEVKEALVALFTNKVPTMNITDAEGLSNKVVADMYAAGTLVTTEEWVKIVPGIMQGVIFQLTGSGCYSPTLHDHIVPGRCYAHHCQRTLKKVNLQTQTTRSSESWADFYQLKKEDWEGRDKKDLERQYMLHEVVQTEDMYMEQLNVLRMLYRDPLLSSAEPSIISPKRKEKFLKDVFGRLDAIKQANEDHLLPQLKYRQQEQGPWVSGFSDIFRQWIRKAKAAYIDYAGGFPGATFYVRQEIDRNIEFRNFVERARNDKRSTKLGWDTFLKAPITRLQRYTLLLNSVLKTMKSESQEKTNLKVAYDEVKAVTLECDARVAEMQRKIDLTDLSHKLVLRPGMKDTVTLNLDHFGRELIHRGDLQRMGGNRFTWLDSHALLFDHFLVLAKTVAQRAEQGGKLEKYDVSRLPIPMDLLILESANDPAVQKRDYVKGITSVRDVGARTATPGADNNSSLTAAGRAAMSASPAPGDLKHMNTGSSGTSLQTVTSLGDSKDADKIMYPFKVKHLGRETYTLFAPTESARRDWCTKIIEAKTKHAASLYNQNAEPFKLRVMADAAFVFDAFAGQGGKSMVIKGTPVDRAIKEVEQKFKETGRPGPICRARVNCATGFATQYPGKEMIAVGTDFGVFVSEMDNPRGWTKSIPMARVTQIAVLEEFNLFLLISDKALIAYHLDVVCPTTSNGPAPTADSLQKAAKKISGSKDVGFFVTGRMKERTLVFYKKRENVNSIFKVMEPVYQKSTEKKRGMFKRGNTEFFREYDEFYIPAECNGVNLFHSSLAVSTARGFEVMTLDKKQPCSIPELREQNVQNIATTIKDQKALAMLRLSDEEFLLVYINCAVYVNKHGDVSRSVIMEFVGAAQSAALYGAYLLLFDSDFVEIRNAQNGRLKQIIAGKEIKCLDDGGTWSSATSPQGTNGTVNGASVSGRTVKLVMQHPENERTQLVMELLLNENLRDGK